MPLTWNIPIQTPPPPPRKASSPLMSYSNRGYNHAATPPRKPPPIEKRRLPLPKNVVLLSLIEATEIATEHSTSPTRPPSSHGGSPAVSPKENKASPEPAYVDDEVDEDEERINNALVVAIGSCGTHVVLPNEGLQIYPSHPTSESLSKSSKKEGPSEEDVESLVRFFHLDHKMDVNSEDDDLQKSDSGASKELAPVQLKSGDRVQIVSSENGWAKLARGYGYVRLKDQNSLVKVGGAVDKACKLEAMLRALSLRRKDLRREQSKVDTRFVALMSELQNSLFNDEDLTVIPADTFAPYDAALLTPATPPASAVASAEIRPRNSEEEDDNSITLQKPIVFHRVETPEILPSFSGCFSDTMFDSVYSAGGGREALPPLDTNALTGEPPSGPLSRGVLSQGARAWRERNSRQESRTVDFRTGMSGHLGPTSHHHPHAYLNPNRSHGAWRMSSHSGLTTSRRRRPTSPPSETGYLSHGGGEEERKEEEPYASPSP